MKKIKTGLFGIIASMVLIALPLGLIPGGSSQAGAAPSQIVIGTICSCAGVDAATQGPAIPTMIAWSKYINAQGGINGHQVKLYSVDDGESATTALGAAQKLIEQDHVSAIVDDSSNFDTAWAAYAEAQGVPVVGGQSEHTPFFTNPDFFPQGTNAVGMYYGVEKVAKTNANGGQAKLAVSYCAEAPACASVVPIMQSLSNSAGVTIVDPSPVSATAPNYTAFCQSTRNSGAQSYIILEEENVVESITTDCWNQGIHTRVIGENATVPLNLSAPAWQNWSGPEEDIPYYVDSTSATKAYQSAMKKYAPTTSLVPYSIYAWTSGQLFAAAIEAANAKTVTPETVKTGLYKLPKGDTLNGLAPPLTFTKGKPAQIDCYFLGGAKNGTPTLPVGTTTACVPTALATHVIGQL